LTSSLDAVVGLIKYRLTSLDKNFMAVVVGETGSGKSAAALELAHSIDPSFIDNPRIVFTPVEFMRTVKELKDERERGIKRRRRSRKENKRYSTKNIVRMKPTICIIFDEAGVGIPAREWQRIQNKLIGYVAQLFRHLNLCILFTVPSMSFIDTQIRKLMHAIIETKTIDRKHMIGVTKYWMIKHNAVFDQTRLEPLVMSNDRGHHTIDPLYVPFPPNKLWKRYIGMKEAYASKFYDNVYKELKGESRGMDGNRTRKLTNQSKCCLKLLPLMKENKTWDEMETLTGFSKRVLRDWTNTAEGAEAADV